MGAERERRRGRRVEDDAIGAGAGHGGRAALPACRRDRSPGRRKQTGENLRPKSGQVRVLVAARRKDSAQATETCLSCKGESCNRTYRAPRIYKSYKSYKSYSSYFQKFSIGE